jgi:hypothetical protein
MATDLAVASGMGRGEYQSAFANFRALSVRRLSASTVMRGVCVLVETARAINETTITVD